METMKFCPLWWENIFSAFFKLKGFQSMPICVALPPCKKGLNKTICIVSYERSISGFHLLAHLGFRWQNHRQQVVSLSISIASCATTAIKVRSSEKSWLKKRFVGGISVPSIENVGVPVSSAGIMGI